MDLFPKDYKKNNLPAANLGFGAGFLEFLKNLKNKLFPGSGNFSANSRIKEALLRLGVIISSAALVLVLLLWGGLFFYKKSLASQIGDLKRQQSEIFSAGDKELAAKIVALDKGASLAQALLKNHIYASGVFDKLAAATIPRVQWRSFDLSVKDRSLVLNGFSADYSNLAKQMIALEEGGFFNIKITNIALDKTGGVGFMAAFNFDPRILQK